MRTFLETIGIALGFIIIVAFGGPVILWLASAWITWLEAHPL